MAIPAAQRRWLDPSTRDYVVERGGPRADATRASKVLLRMTMKRGSCAVAPTLGSRLHTIRRESVGVIQRAEAYALECVEDLVRRHEIRDVTAAAQVVRSSSGASLDVELAFLDTAGDPRSVRVSQRVGP